MRIIAMLAVLAILGFTPTAFAQLSEQELDFYPAFPTDKNEVTAIISLTTGTPCEKVESQGHELDGNNLSINVRIVPPPPDTSCAQVVTQHVLEQDIGRLEAGTYAVQLYVDGTPRASATLHVSADDVAILSTGKYTDDQGDINLVGEVQNVADHPVKLVQIGVLFFEEDDGALVKEQKKICTMMALIMPNRTSGFSLGLGSDLQDNAYSVNITSFSVEDKPVERGLMLVVEPALGSDGYGVVGGHVLNRADHDATQVKVVCAIYDDDGNVVDSIFGYTNPDTIPPRQTAPFSILTHSKISQGFTTSCNAESIELAIEEVQVVPEFSAIDAVVVAGASLAAVLAVNRLRNKL
ncbi:MAG: FxLYD domain-containing protein [Nitrososphaera sp.]